MSLFSAVTLCLGEELLIAILLPTGLARYRLLRCFDHRQVGRDTTSDESCLIECFTCRTYPDSLATVKRHPASLSLRPRPPDLLQAAPSTFAALSNPTERAHAPSAIRATAVGTGADLARYHSGLVAVPFRRAYNHSLLRHVLHRP